MRTLASAAFAFTAALALTATAQPAAAPPAAKPAAARHACFWRRDISNFAANDDQHVYLRVGVSQVWELTLFSHCLDLDWVHHLGLSTFGGYEPDICEGSNPGVDVVVHDVGLGHMRCPITSVRLLTPDEAKALPKNARP